MRVRVCVCMCVSCRVSSGQKLISIAAWSVGAYGTGKFYNAQPIAADTGQFRPNHLISIITIYIYIYIYIYVYI